MAMSFEESGEGNPTLARAAIQSKDVEEDVPRDVAATASAPQDLDL
jgi:hypothetical protein